MQLLWLYQSLLYFCTSVPAPPWCSCATGPCTISRTTARPPVPHWCSRTAGFGQGICRCRSVCSHSLVLALKFLFQFTLKETCFVLAYLTALITQDVELSLRFLVCVVLSAIFIRGLAPVFLKQALTGLISVLLWPRVSILVTRISVIFCCFQSYWGLA